MARGGRVIYKRTTSSKRNRKSKLGSDDDDENDEEYKIEEDDDEYESNNESDVNSKDLTEEECFEYSGSDSLDDEIDVIVKKSRKNGRKSMKSRGSKKQQEISDSDYEFSIEEWKKNGRNLILNKKGKGRKRKQEVSDSDYELNEKSKNLVKFDDEIDGELVSKRRGKGRMKTRVVSDSDFELDDLDDENEMLNEYSKSVFGDEMDGLSVSKKGGKGRRRKQEVSDSDFELDYEDEEEEFEIDNKLKKKQNNRRKVGVSDDEVDGILVFKKRARCKRLEISDSDFNLEDENKDKEFEDKNDRINSRVCDEEMEGFLVPNKRGRGRPKENTAEFGSYDDAIEKRGKWKSRNLKSRDSDYELDEEDGDYDEDFSPDLDEFDEDEISIAPKKRLNKKGKNISRESRVVMDDEFVVKGRVSVGKKRRKNNQANKKKSLENAESLDLNFDDDFVENNLVRIDGRKKSSKKGKKKKGQKKKRLGGDSESSDSDFVISEDEEEEYEEEEVEEEEEEDYEFDDEEETENKKEIIGKSNRRRKRKRSSADSESLEPDYLISEDDDEFIVDQPKKKSKKSKKNRTVPNKTGKRLKSTLHSDSDSDSFNFDDVSEEEFSDLGIESPKRIVPRKKGEEKGKEKQVNNDSGNQVCGICLSEEKKSVIQGLLDCCTHYFCFACIMEWSKVETRCPLCKGRFATISKLGQPTQGFGVKRSSVIKVEKRDQVYQPSEEELRGMLDPYENVVCMECQQGGDDNLMLLCDTCDSSAHTYCVGLGREVPEGNWYCELCMSVSNMRSDSHIHNNNIMPNQESISSNLFSDVHTSTNSPRPSSLRIDLNAPPRDFHGDDQFVLTPNSGNGASTVLGRRHIRQRIHVILSNNRQRQTDLLSFEQNPRPLFRSHANLGPSNFSEGSSFRHVDGAKEEVQHMVKRRMKYLNQNRLLDYSAFKEIARKSTHSVLAACGIEHNRNMVSSSIEPPDNCVHNSNDGPTHLLKDCCSFCFTSFVNDVVQRIINSTS